VVEAVEEVEAVVLPLLLPLLLVLLEPVLEVPPLFNAK